MLFQMRIGTMLIYTGAVYPKGWPDGEIAVVGQLVSLCELRASSHPLSQSMIVAIVDY